MSRRSGIPKKHADWSRLARIAATLTLAAVAGFSAHWGWTGLHRPDVMPLSRIAVDGELTRQRRDQLEAVVTLAVSGNFFTVDIESIRRAATSLSWVESTSVRREWPDTLVIRVAERKAFARWGESALVSGTGRIFEAAAQDEGDLPYLEGPDARGAEVVQRYRALEAELRAAGLRLVALRLDERAGWTLRLESGHEIALGGEALEARLQRVLRVLRAAGDKAPAIEHMDARYSSGVAVRWKAQEAAGASGEPPVRG